MSTAWGGPHDVAGLRTSRRRLLRARRRSRAGVAQLMWALAGLALGLALPYVDAGPSVSGTRLAEPLFTLGIGVIGILSIVYTLLFGVVQWSFSSFSPRLTLFRADPLVWRTFAFGVGVFVYSVTAGLVSSKADEVSVLVPVVAVLAVLLAFALIRQLQFQAFLSLQLAHVLAQVAGRGREIIEDIYDIRATSPAPARADEATLPALRSTARWTGPPGVVQQLELHALLKSAADADAVVVFRVGVGDMVYEGSPVADVHGGQLSGARVCEAVVRGAERSFDQDPMFAFRLLADIALRALSTAINDPATAVDALDATEGLLRALASRDLDVADLVDDAGVLRLRLRLPTWDDYLRTALVDLLPVAAPFEMVLRRLKPLLASLSEMADPADCPAVMRLSEQVDADLARCRRFPDEKPSGEA